MVLANSAPPFSDVDEEMDDDDLDRTVVIGESNSFLEPSVGSASPPVPGSPLV
jgi:hypothetical protein